MIRVQLAKTGVRGPRKHANGVPGPVRPGAFRRHRRSMCAPNLMQLSPLQSFFDLSPSHLLETEDFMGLERARTMAVDFVEDATSFQIKADIPGVSKSDIKLDVDHNVITISASRSQTSDNTEGPVATDEAKVDVDGEAQSDEDKMGKVKSGDDHAMNVLRFERYDSFVSRSFRMPKTADLSTISAKYENGVLTIDIQKSPDLIANRRTIDIE